MPAEAPCSATPEPHKRRPLPRPSGGRYRRLRRRDETSSDPRTVPRSMRSPSPLTDAAEPRRGALQPMPPWGSAGGGAAVGSGPACDAWTWTCAAEGVGAAAPIPGMLATSGRCGAPATCAAKGAGVAASCGLLASTLIAAVGLGSGRAGPRVVGVAVGAVATVPALAVAVGSGLFVGTGCRVATAVCSASGVAASGEGVGAGASGTSVGTGRGVEAGITVGVGSSCSD